MDTHNRPAMPRWTLADLVDFETLMALDDGTVEPLQRQHFRHDIRPQLEALSDAAARRRVGLRLWLEQRREQSAPSAGQLVGQALNGAGWAACAVSFCIGIGLVTGFMAGAHPAVHVVIFVGLTLLLPWLLLAVGAVARALGRGSGGLFLLLRAALQLFGPRGDQTVRMTVLAALAEARATRRVLWAEIMALTQRAAVGFNLGLLLAFGGCLLLFDVHFYWAATPQAGMTALLSALVHLVALPWFWWWPQAVPDMADINSARLLVGGLPALGDGSWWRFLLMALLVWGLLARTLLLAWFRRQGRQALSQLDFQAPRHRALWRALSAVERGEVATGAADGALVLDVGGHGVTGAMLRGFLLRRLRVNPLQTLPIAVLDEQREAQTQQALAAAPTAVVLLVEDSMLSPRQIAALQQRLRGLLGPQVALTWLVFAWSEQRQPTAPAVADMQRWARIIDGLRDPAVEIMAYDA